MFKKISIELTRNEIKYGLKTIFLSEWRTLDRKKGKWKKKYKSKLRKS